jgi:hypothetical protein
MYKYKQQGEPESAGKYTNKERQLFTYINYAEYIANQLNIRTRKRRIEYIINNIKSLNDLHPQL